MLFQFANCISNKENILYILTGEYVRKGKIMPTYGMGEAIREMRMRLGYTQEELAYGICTTGTLSKIENGRSIISKRVFEALCSKMPGIHHVWISCDTKAEMERSRLCKQILLYLELRKMNEAKAAMEQYRRRKEKDNPFCMQFDLYTQAIYQAILKKDEGKILPKLKMALAVTMPDYKERFRAKKKAVLLTYDEVYILSNMGIAYAKKDRSERAYSIFCFLKEYIRQQEMDLAESMKINPMILGNLAWLLERQGQFREAVKQCDECMEVCILANKYTVLPYLLCIKSRCLTALGNLETAKKSRQQAKAILGIRNGIRSYGGFEEFYKAQEPIYVTF